MCTCRADSHVSLTDSRLSSDRVVERSETRIVGEIRHVPAVPSESQAGENLTFKGSCERETHRSASRGERTKFRYDENFRSARDEIPSWISSRPPGRRTLIGWECAGFLCRAFFNNDVQRRVCVRYPHVAKPSRHETSFFFS